MTKEKSKESIPTEPKVEEKPTLTETTVNEQIKPVSTETKMEQSKINEEIPENINFQQNKSDKDIFDEMKQEDNQKIEFLKFAETLKNATVMAKIVSIQQKSLYFKDEKGKIKGLGLNKGCITQLTSLQLKENDFISINLIGWNNSQTGKYPKIILKKYCSICKKFFTSTEIQFCEHQ